jgi:hypothetical protein
MHAPERPSGSFLRPFESRHCFGRNELVWDGLRLRLRTMGGPVMATVEADANWPGMWRVRFGGRLSDMANLSRAKDAAISLVLGELNGGSHANKSPRRD